MTIKSKKSKGQAAQAATAEPVALSAIAEWDTAPVMTKYGAGMMQAVLAISRDETLTLTCHKDALRLPSPLHATPPAPPDFPDWLYQMYDVIPYISRNKQSGVKLVFTSDDMANSFLKWLAAKDDEFVKWSAK